jgi:hypothetical protein
MVEMIASFIFERLLDIVPKWLARCFISSQKIANQIEIDLRRITPINISFGTDIPSLTLYFRISNLSHVDLVLDRLLINLWVGQPTLQGAILVRYDVPKRSSREDVYFNTQLTVPQQEQIRKHVNGQVLSVPVTINVQAYFDSKAGLVYVEKKFEHREVPCK